MRTNVKIGHNVRTHEGAPAALITPAQELRRSVASCLLWEDTFYESGQDIAARIHDLAGKVDPSIVSALAIEARSHMNLRHAPLWLTVGLIEHARGNPAITEAVAGVIQRGDEIAELLAMYWKDGKRPVPRTLRRGLAQALAKFDEFKLSRYARADKGDKVKLRDVLRVVHPKPGDDAARNALYARIVKQELAVADTWETGMVAGTSGEAAGKAKSEEDKRAVFERQLTDGKLGYLALLRNLRNMTALSVDENLIKTALIQRKGARRVLPFRYVAAARACPQLEPWIDQALVESIAEMRPLPGKTIVLVDVSQSMDAPMSVRAGGGQRKRKPGEPEIAPLNRIDAAAALAAIVPGEVRIFSFSNALVEVPPRRGMAGVDAIRRSQPHGGTLLGAAVARLNEEKGDRLIVITDEQSQDAVPQPTFPRAYLINVAAYQNGVGYGGAWTHIDGFSESVLRYIGEVEREPRERPAVVAVADEEESVPE